MSPNKNEVGTNNNRKYIKKFLDSSYQRVKRLFDLPYKNIEDNANKVDINSFKKYFLPRVKVENYNIEIDGLNFYDQPINDLIKQYDEIRKTLTGQDDDYITGCLLDYTYFKDNYRLIAADLSKQKVLDADPRAIKQIVFAGVVKTTATIYYIVEQSKETILEF